LKYAKAQSKAARVPTIIRNGMKFIGKNTEDQPNYAVPNSFVVPVRLDQDIGLQCAARHGRRDDIDVQPADNYHGTQ
jgi:hypothetical protein